MIFLPLLCMHKPVFAWVTSVFYQQVHKSTAIPILQFLAYSILLSQVDHVHVYFAAVFQVHLLGFPYPAIHLFKFPLVLVYLFPRKSVVVVVAADIVIIMHFGYTFVRSPTRPARSCPCRPLVPRNCLYFSSYIITIYTSTGVSMGAIGTDNVRGYLASEAVSHQARSWWQARSVCEEHRTCSSLTGQSVLDST